MLLNDSICLKTHLYFNFKFYTKHELSTKRCYMIVNFEPFLLLKMVRDILQQEPYRIPSGSFTTGIQQINFKFSNYRIPTEYLQVLLLLESYRLHSGSFSTRVLQNNFRFSYNWSPTE